MEKEFIPHEQAFILKEMGFSELCVKVCFKDGSATYNRIGNEGEAMCQSDKKEGKDYAATIPTYSQAFRWFREKHELYQAVYADKRTDDLTLLYKVHVYKLDEELSEYTYRWAKTYEAAEQACLDKLIEIVKKR